MAKRYVLKLTQEERCRLGRIAKGRKGGRTIAAWKLKRAQVSLKSDRGGQGDGWTDHRLAAAFDLTAT